MPASDSGAPLWIVAVTGGVGSGKSTVARAFAELGAHVIDADAISREVVDSPGVRSRLEDAFGTAMTTADGSLDRKALADLVFTDRGARERLDAIVHPEVRRRIDKELAHLAARGSDEASPLPGKRPLVLLDIPLLETSPFHDRADVVLFVDAPPRDRRRRVAEARGWPPEELTRREDSQVPIDEKRSRAHRVLPNFDGAEGELAGNCRALIAEWCAALATDRDTNC